MGWRHKTLEGSTRLLVLHGPTRCVEQKDLLCLSGVDTYQRVSTFGGLSVGSLTLTVRTTLVSGPDTQGHVVQTVSVFEDIQKIVS